MSIDGGAWKSHDLYHRYSRGLHYPRTVMFATDLISSEHIASIRMSGKSNKESKGSSARILNFTVNR